MNELTKQHITTIRDAAKKLTGAKRRSFQAQVTIDYLGGTARRAEAVFGWCRKAVEVKASRPSKPLVKTWQRS